MTILGAFLQQRRQRRLALADLLDLNDRMLRDIGLEPRQHARFDARQFARLQDMGR
jgi:uncharacterized protein YjiS (DUF1127 family)